MDTDAYLEIGCQFKESQIVDFLTKEIVYSSMTYDNCLDRLLDKENTDVSACKTVLEKVEEFKS